METSAPRPKAKAKASKAPAKKPKAPKAKKAKKASTALMCYSPEIANQICSAIAETKSLRTIGKMPGMPSVRTITEWQSTRPEFALMLDRARELRADARVEAISDLANRVIAGKLDPHAGRTAIEALKWLASRENWRRWGDKSAMVVANVPAPAESAREGLYSPAAEALIAKIGKIAARQREGLSQEQVRALEDGRCRPLRTPRSSRRRSGSRAAPASS